MHVVEKFGLNIEDFRQDYWDEEFKYSFLQSIIDRGDLELLFFLKNVVGVTVEDIRESNCLTWVFNGIDVNPDKVQIFFFLLHEFDLEKEDFLDEQGHLPPVLINDDLFPLVKKIHDKYGLTCKNIQLTFLPWNHIRIFEYILFNLPDENQAFLVDNVERILGSTGRCPAYFFLLLQQKLDLFTLYKNRQFSILYNIDPDTITPDVLAVLITEMDKMSPRDRLVMFDFISKYGSEVTTEQFQVSCQNFFVNSRR
jgi:hypothetical protein